MLDHSTFGWPLIIAGCLKATYDLLLLGMFRNIRPPEDLLPYLVWRIERSAPQAREIVRRLDEKADAEHRAISKALAREILEAEAQADLALEGEAPKSGA